jgi:hypothetical protein
MGLIWQETERFCTVSRFHLPWVSSALHLRRGIAVIARRVRFVIDGGDRYFDVLASFSILTSLSISRHVCSST